MKEIDKRIQEVKEAHSLLSKEIQQLEALALKEREEKEFKENDWVIWSGINPAIGKIDRQDNGHKCYGLKEFSGKGLYTSCHINNLRKATPEEIEKHLISEAEKKGFVKGAKVQYKTWQHKINRLEVVDNTNERITAACQDYFDANGIHVAIHDGPAMFPLNECTIFPSTPQISIGGKPVEFKDTGAIVLGKFFHNREFNEQRAIFRVLHNANVKVKGLLIQTCQGEEVLITPDQVTAITEHFEGRNKI